MSDVTYTSQGLSSETIGANRSQIFKCLKLGRGKPLAKNG